jgi:hypothetical protein
MKKIIWLALILFSVNPAFSQTPQDKPLTQAEYVRLLYDLEKNPQKKETVIEIVRRRGIAFQITDGLRSLTATKSRGDAELKRTLEESGRRQGNPAASQLPSTEESASILAKAREATLAAVAEMPDFVVKQMIQRGDAFAGTNNFRNRDRLVVAVSYRSPEAEGAQGAEEYRVLSVNGVQQATPQVKSSYEEVGGTSSTGEFVTVLATIFKSENETAFAPVDTDVIRARRAIVYNFEIKKEKAPQQIGVSGNLSTTAGMKGKIWIDRENSRILRIESVATEIPQDFPVQAASRTIDYDWVTIADEKYLLPSLSDVRLTSRYGREMYETRNVIRFKDYQKYGSEVRILEDDEAPTAVDETPKKP